MPENTKNVLLLLIAVIFIIKSCQMFLEFKNINNEGFANTRSIYPNYEKLLKNIKEYKNPNKSESSVEILSTDPPIFTISKFFSRKESDHLIHLYNSFLKSSTNKSNDTISLDRKRNASVFHLINELSKLIMVPAENSNQIKIDKITPKSIKDSTNYDSILFNDSTIIDSQMIFTIKGFLNNFEGGEIKLNGINKTIKPEKGKIIVICNCQNGTKIRHEKSSYTRSPVKSGSEYLFDVTFNDFSMETIEIREAKRKGLQRLKYFKEEASKKYDSILKEAEFEFNEIMEKAFKIRDKYGIDDKEEYAKLMAETKFIRDQFK